MLHTDNVHHETNASRYVVRCCTQPGTGATLGRRSVHSGCMVILAPVVAYRHARLGFIHAWVYEVVQHRCRAFGTMIERSVLLSEGGARLSCSLTSTYRRNAPQMTGQVAQAKPLQRQPQLYYRDKSNFSIRDNAIVRHGPQFEIAGSVRSEMRGSVRITSWTLHNRSCENCHIRTVSTDLILQDLICNQLLDPAIFYDLSLRS